MNDLELTRAKVSSRKAITVIKETLKKLHKMLHENRDASLLPKRFLEAMTYGFSLDQFFIVWNFKVDCPRSNEEDGWYFGLRMKDSIKDSELGVLEQFQGTFDKYHKLQKGTMVEEISVEKLLDWLWESPWLSRISQGRETPHSYLLRHLNHWVSLVEAVPVTNQQGE